MPARHVSNSVKLFIFALAACQPTIGEPILPGPVVPNANTGVEGSVAMQSVLHASFSLPPFDPIIDFSARFQQVFAASQFPSAMWIQRLAFRPDAYSGEGFSHTSGPDVQINLSTTSIAPGDLSETFSENVGPDDTPVFCRISLPMSSSFEGPAEGPKDFNIFIDLQVPFLYRPSEGNLLLDMRIFLKSGLSLLDGEYIHPDYVTQMVSSRDNGTPFAGVNALTGSLSSAAYIMRFDGVPLPASAAGALARSAVDPVPEPAAWILLSCGCAFIAFKRAWHNSKSPMT